MFSLGSRANNAKFGSPGIHTDVWGFATTILHMATGQLPYRVHTPHQTLMAMIRQRPPSVPETLSWWLQQLLRQCLTFDADARPTVAQLPQVMLPLFQA